MKKFSKLIFIVFIVSGICSCDIQKQSAKSKTDTDLNENYERTEKRDGGIASFRPEPNIVYRDTTIYIQGTNGTDLKIIYDRQGNMTQTDCEGALIDIVEKYDKRLREQTKEKDKEKTEKFSDGWVLYVMIGVAVMFCFAFFIMWRNLSQNAAAVKGVLEQLGNLKNNM